MFCFVLNQALYPRWLPRCAKALSSHVYTEHFLGGVGDILSFKSLLSIFLFPAVLYVAIGRLLCIPVNACQLDQIVMFRELKSKFLCVLNTCLELL